MKCLPHGPLDAHILIVGEAPGTEEEMRGLPFVGPSGHELTRMLADAGIPREACFLTNVARHRPPHNDISEFFLDSKQTKPGPVILEGIEELRQEILSVRPNVVIAFGNTPLWALTGHRGIVSWRGSVLQSHNSFGPVKVIPTYHPAAILRQWDWRFIAVQDLRKVVTESKSPSIPRPQYNFTVRPTYATVVGVLENLTHLADQGSLRLAVDLETRGGHTACIGIAWSNLDALCVPLMCVERPAGYWTLDEEVLIVKLIRRVLTHPNVKVVGQNFLYDNQYNALQWGFAPPVYMDTMIAHHVCWPGLPKSLGFLSSMYCQHHEYWKDEGKLWDPTKIPEERLWLYNCTDAVKTFEVSNVLDSVIDKLKLREQFAFQMQVFHKVFKMMLRGVAVDLDLRNNLALELFGMISERHTQILRLAGRSFLGKKGGFSPKQLADYFYDLLRLPEQRNRKTGKRTCDGEALVELARREPIIRRLVYSINETRQLGTALSVVKTPLGVDKRLRCSYNVAGTDTFRFSSSEDAFGSGTNLQNVSIGRKSEETGLQLPNLRRLFRPDEGKMIGEVDLGKADLYVDAWESGDQQLKKVLKSGVDVHLANAKLIYKLSFPDSDLINPEAAAALKVEYYWKRHAAKEFVHATHKGGKARTVSAVIGETVHATERYQAAWFAAHPKILEWHRQVERQLMTRREVRNVFGYRIFFFGRVEELLGEAIAWLAQSTVALVINRGLVNLDTNCPEIEVLLQVHDSLTFQFPTHRYPAILHEIKPQLLIPIPYPDPLTIPVTFSVSEKSWGDVEETEI